MDTVLLDLELQSLTVFSGVLKNAVIGAMRNLVRLAAENASRRDLVYAASALYRAALDDGCEDNIGSALLYSLRTDENPYARQAAFHAGITDSLRTAALHDLNILTEMISAVPETVSSLGADIPVCTDDGETLPADSAALLDYLTAHYAKNGYGLPSVHAAFKYDGRLTPIERTDTVRLSSLKGYDSERAAVEENTEAFVNGLYAQNVLLYGDRGTGKSATVHALLNEYSPRGLRMVQIPKRYLDGLGSLINELSHYANRFIIFIDDLSLNGSELTLSDLKAVLEGSLEERPENILVYATSNRRHLVKEIAQQDHAADVSEADSKEDMLSLSDRFGLTVTFFNPNMRTYSEIVEFLAKEQGIDIDRETLLRAAERYAISRGVRSPRAAKQFIEYAVSRLHMGLDL